MIINVKGVGKVEFPDDMNLDEINKILTKAFSESKVAGVEEITAIVRGIVGEVIKPEPAIVPDVQVEPVVEVTNTAPDMQPIAEALAAVLSRPEPDITVQLPARAGIVDIEVTERDTFGNIKRLRMTEIS